ncbi:MAG: ORF6N domain-containing protein [Chitinophagaceae bacterium]|nr:ORF6N domain-containing protein [Chitinophagaceae bacterium]
MEVTTIIQNRIYEIRGERVMLDFDLAELYEVETKRLNEQVKRNIERFPKEFMFRLTVAEWQLMWSQIATTSEQNNSMRSQIVTPSPQKRRKDNMPFAFTEHGVAMLASVLKSQKAIQMNIAIVKAFIALRSFTVHNHEILNQLMELRDRIGEHDIQLKQIYDALENLLDKQVTIENWNTRERIGFKKK